MADMHEQQRARSGGPRIGVVTVTYNSAAVIDEFVESLLAQRYGSFRLFLVDNRSSDDTLARLGAARRDPRVEVIASERNAGVAAGNNLGIRRALESGCELVLLVNNDTVFGPDLLGTLVEELAAHGADMVTPKITYHDAPRLVWCAGGSFRRWLARMPRHIGYRQADDGRFDEARAVAYAPTCCVLMRREVFERVGMMDERFFVYWDDVDFMYRAQRAGVRLVYTPKSVLRHKVSSLTGEVNSPFSVRYETRNRAYFIRKHYPWTAPFWLFIAGLFYLSRYFRLRDSWRTLAPRLAAFREGLRLPVP